MRRLSHSSARAYSGITGHQFTEAEEFIDTGGGVGRAVFSAGPTMRKVSGPEIDIEAAVAVLDEATIGGRARNRWLARKAGQRQLGLDEEGQPCLEGRRCCLELALTLDREMHRLVLPTRRVCSGCGTTWVIEMAPREERRHVWTR